MGPKLMITLGQKLLRKGDARALTWFGKAAKAAPEGYEALAACYCKGLGVAQDALRAAKYAKCAKAAHAKARDRYIRLARLHRLTRVGGHVPGRTVSTKQSLEWKLADTNIYLTARCERTRHNCEQKARQTAKKLLALQNRALELAAAQTTDSWFRKRKFLIDGTNLAFWKNRGEEKMHLSTVLAVCMALSARGASFKVVFDASTPYRLGRQGDRGDVNLYRQLLSQCPDMFVEVPSGVQADEVLLMECARERPGWAPTVILSADKFRQYAAEYPFVYDKTRCIRGRVQEGEAVFPAIGWCVPLVEAV